MNCRNVVCPITMSNNWHLDIDVKKVMQKEEEEFQELVQVVDKIERITKETELILQDKSIQNRNYILSLEKVIEKLQQENKEAIYIAIAAAMDPVKRMDEYKNAIEKMNSIKLPMNLSDVADKVDMKRQYIYYKLLNEYTHNEEYPLYQYFAGQKNIYNGKVTISKNNDITEIKNNDGVVGIEDAPIYFQKKNTDQ